VIITAETKKEGPHETVSPRHIPPQQAANDRKARGRNSMKEPSDFEAARAD